MVGGKMQMGSAKVKVKVKVNNLHGTRIINFQKVDTVQIFKHPIITLFIPNNVKNNLLLLQLKVKILLI